MSPAEVHETFNALAGRLSTRSQALHEQLGCQAEDRLLAGALWQAHDLVFASAVGTPLDHHNVLPGFRKITPAGSGFRLGAAGDVACVSLLSSNGTTLKDIADLVGHRGTTTTKTVYRKGHRARIAARW